MVAIKGSHPAQRRYPPEIKERGVRMVHELRRADPADNGVVTRVARQLGVGVESLRSWVKQDEIDGRRPAGGDHGREPGDRRAAQRGQRAPAGQRDLDRGFQFLRGGARPPTHEVVAFIDAHRDDETGGRRWGVEPTCEVLQVAPSTYYAATSRPPSQRSLDDEVLKADIARIHDDHHHGVYGIEKVWWQCRAKGSLSGATGWAAHQRARSLRRGARWAQDPHHHAR